MMNDDMALAQDYAARQSEAAFETLVARHAGLVHAAALRQARDPQLADEITQTVFIILARKAGSLSPKTILPGWLYRTTRYVAAAALKRELRRRKREQEAQSQMISETQNDFVWEQLAPLLDDAMAQLRATDRDALVLRYFQNKNLRDVGAALSVDEYAAQKRVARALEKLRAIFARRGVNSTTAIIAGTISANSVHAMPAVSVKTISAVALAKGAAAGSSTFTLAKGALKLMAGSKAKTAIIAGAVVLLAAGTTTLVLQHQTKPRFSGYATPQATLKTIAWAMSNGDTNAFLACLTPERKINQEKQWQGKSKEKLIAIGRQQFDTMADMKILDQRSVAADNVIITVQLGGTGKPKKVQFKKIGEEWKLE